jgi:site-specific DNA-methyltransferase (adenine-specific)
MTPLIRRILNGDCLDLLGSIPDGSVDLVIFDPPYGTTANAWDKRLPFDQLWPELWRVLAPAGVVLITAQQPFATDVAQSGRRWLRYQWVWEKTTATGFLNARRAPLKAHEVVLVFARRQPSYAPQMTEGKPYKARACRHYSANYNKYAGVAKENPGVRFPRDVVRFTNERGLHPTQKPTALYEYLLRTYSQPGQTVLDPCAGSGTAGEAAERSGRGYILIEREKSYCQIAKNRIRRVRRTIAQAQRQATLRGSDSGLLRARSASRIRR